VRSSMMINAGLPEGLRNQLEMALRPCMKRHPGRLALSATGGGMLGSIASRLQDQASHLVLLGSLVRGHMTMIRMNPETVAADGRSRQSSGPGGPPDAATTRSGLHRGRLSVHDRPAREPGPGHSGAIDPQPGRQVRAAPGEPESPAARNLVVRQPQRPGLQPPR
jgi:hypothetical protein